NFQRRDNFLAHLAKHDNNKTKIKCGSCEKVFANNSNRKRHEENCIQKMPEKCKICKKVCTSRRMRKQHELDVHSKRRDYICTCHAKFKQRRNLLAHCKKRGQACRPIDQENDK
ncbi:unnamed protein product, partial [Owenia fusiformis]